MAGLIKPKNYEWKDSNLEFFGSSTDRQVKKESAATEPAWRGVGQQAGLKIWRIVNFKVTDWPKEDYGKFYGGDSYIVLNTYKPDPSSNELAYDVHFWIGSQSTQDEYGTVAYKTVELDTFLDDKAVQHREVQGHESAKFKSYFPIISILDGGAESGFRHVKPEEYKPRLLHFFGLKKNITVQEIPLVRSRMDSGDVYILDLGKMIYQWNGSGSNKDERFKAGQFLANLRSERSAKSDILEEADTPSNHEFYKALTGKDEVDKGHGDPRAIKELYRVSDASGKLEVKKVKEGHVSHSDLDSKDVFILDCGKECFVWIGKGSTPSEKKNGMSYAHNHLMKTDHQLVPITVVKDGQKSHEFQAALAA